MTTDDSQIGETQQGTAALPPGMGRPDMHLPLHDVDALVRAGDIDGAADRLEQRLADDADLAAQVMPWLQLGGLRRMLRQPYRALAAAESALALAPRDFMALVMRATLIAQITPENAGPAWHRALLQRSDSVLPKPLADAVAAGERTHAAWMAERTSRLGALSQRAAVVASEDENWRMRRFCDNTLGIAQRYRSEPVAFFYPGLAEREFHPRARFPWLAELEAATPHIRTEMQALLADRNSERVPYIRYADHQALDQWRPLNHNPDWSALHLWQNGQRIAVNADRCPETVAILSRVQQPVIGGASPNAMFSLLAPHTAIPAHVGVCNTRLVCHLPLVVPAGCWFRVGAETRLWHEGQAFVFDDTIEHEADNPTDHLRVVLIFDVWHPDLSAIERDLVAHVISAEHACGALD